MAGPARLCGVLRASSAGSCCSAMLPRAVGSYTVPCHWCAVPAGLPLPSHRCTVLPALQPWHPLTFRNMARVWEKEHEHYETEKKKVQGCSCPGCHRMHTA